MNILGNILKGDPSSALTNVFLVFFIFILIIVSLAFYYDYMKNKKNEKKISILERAIKDLIEDRFGDLNTMIDEMVKSAMTIQGSGWVYLSKTGLIKTTPNQSYKTDILMPIDMWEHSFTDYIPAKDAKAKYIKAMMTIIDWDQINMRIGK